MTFRSLLVSQPAPAVALRSQAGLESAAQADLEEALPEDSSVFSGLEDSGVVAFVERLGQFAERLILLGASDQAEKLIQRNPQILYLPERSPDAVTRALKQVATRLEVPKLSLVTYLGDSAYASPVRIAAAVLKVELREDPFSIEAVLMAFGVEPELAASLAAGVEEALGLGAGA